MPLQIRPCSALYQGAKSQRYGGPHVLLPQEARDPDCRDGPEGARDRIPTAKSHFISDRPLKGPYPEGSERAIFGFGCFWGAERKFWQMPEGVWVTAAGYAGGPTPNPTYEEVCSGRTGHNEVVLVVYDPKAVSYETLLKTFWESHDPTQGMRQGNDVGTQYRSGIYVTSPAQRQAAEASKAAYQKVLAPTAMGRSRPRSSTRRSSISPRTITSSIWRRCRTDIAGWAARGCRAPSEWA